ncbi:transposase [Diaphorobacter ruginosibacter]|uniref:transposase n=1 Tax=Diaphorobacter ruginosibacter TaxID=1715720 RepID=UPI003CCDF0AE
MSACMDLYNREIVAYRMARRPVFEMVSSMLEAALSRTSCAAGLIVHSDQGWHYKMQPYRAILASHGVKQSMSRKGNCFDNAAIESYFGTLKAEYFHLDKPDSIDALEAGVHDYVHYYNHERNQLEQQAQDLLANDADYNNLMSLPGVGPITALTILAEAGNLRRFGHHRQFLKFCGFDLAKSQSGVHRGREQLSKRGNARLRLAFWLAAVEAIRIRENSFREKYDRYVSCNPKDPDLKRKALKAVAAKMARMAYGIIKKLKSPRFPEPVRSRGWGTV